MLGREGGRDLEQHTLPAFLCDCSRFLGPVKSILLMTNETDYTWYILKPYSVQQIISNQCLLS